jgi:putative transposase
MKKRFTEEQIIRVLKEHAAGGNVGELCRRHGISQTTLYKWKAKFGGMEVSDARKLKALEAENAKLKKLVADLSLDKLMLQEVVSKNW